MTIDEVIAANVKRIREDRKLSRGDLADRLGVGPHVVRDYERPRKGQPQRSFAWEEIVRLCFALETTLFDLVLPSPGDEIDQFDYPFPTSSQTAESFESVGWGDLVSDVKRLQRDARSVLAEALFGHSKMVDTDALQTLTAMAERDRKKREAIIDRLAGEMGQRIREALEEEQ